MKPYDIRLKEGTLPKIVIYAPAMEGTPHKWLTRLRWAWRCLRGKSIDLNPGVSITGSTFYAPPNGGSCIDVLPDMDVSEVRKDEPR